MPSMTGQLPPRASSPRLVAGSGGTARPAARVVVSAEHRLLAELLRAALGSRGYVVRILPWPAGPTTGSAPGLCRQRWHVGVALADLTAVDTVTEVGRLVRGARTRWLLVTSGAPGPLWGGALEHGMHAVCSTSLSVDDLAEAIDVLAGGGQLLDAQRASELRAAWHEARATEVTLRDRVQSLSKREVEVLARLYDGQAVVEIAADLGVSLSTARSHVRAILRKLGARSQLRAVALYAEFLNGGTRTLAR